MTKLETLTENFWRSYFHCGTLLSMEFYYIIYLGLMLKLFYPNRSKILQLLLNLRKRVLIEFRGISSRHNCSSNDSSLDQIKAPNVNKNSFAVPHLQSQEFDLFPLLSMVLFLSNKSATDEYIIRHSTK